ncbi:MAG: LytTR family DNA-binding domain-containing protein [Bacteroidota bacterium]
MEKIKCVVVDDEPLSREVLRSYIHDHNQLELVAECVDALEAGSVLREEPVDLLFLDINMPKLSGINFYKGLEKKPLVVFTTAYPNYAVEGFELNAVDYLVKPFGFDRFYAAVEKVIAQKAQVQSHTTYLTVKVDKKLFKIDYQEIVYIESIGDYAKLHLKDKVLITSETLRGYERSLPSSKFVRIHKSYIISIDCLEYIEGNQVKISEVKLPVGKSYRDALRDKLS